MKRKKGVIFFFWLAKRSLAKIFNERENEREKMREKGKERERRKRERERESCLK